MSGRNQHGNLVVTTCRDLLRKYARDKQAIHTTWKSLSPEKRKELILAGAAGGEEGFLRHPDDDRLGNVRYIIPELNLRDLVAGDNLLELLDKRGTTPILEMYPYDCHTMRTSMYVNGISHATGRKKGAVMRFLDEEKYGEAFELTQKSKGDEMDNMVRLGKGWVLFENEGAMILDRQYHIYAFLSILVDDIMDMKRMINNPDWDKKLPTRKRAAVGSKEEIEQTLQRLAVSGNSRGSGSKGGKVKAKPSLKDIVDRLAQDSQEQLLSADDHVNLICQESLYCSHVASNYFFSSPTMVLDEEGHQGSVFTAKMATRAVLELLQDAYQATAYWKYLSILTSELAKNTRQGAPQVRNSLTDELWATCTKELLRARAIYRRFVQTELKYSKFFVRTKSGPSSVDEVKLKDGLGTVAKKNQFTYWILQLTTRTELSDSDVAQLLKSIDNFQETVPKARELISESMGDALADISVIVAFMDRLRQVILVPRQALSSNFEKKIATRSTVMGEVWDGLDLADYVFPVNNLKEPSAAQNCLRIVNERLFGSQIGVDLSNVFQEPIENSVLEAFERLAESKVQVASQENVPFDPFINHQGGEGSNQPTNIVQPKPKRKNEVSTLEAADNAKKYFSANVSQHQSPIEVKPITTSPTAVKTFKKLFRSDPSTARSSIPWSAFVSAMTSIGFTVEPIGGSIMRFRPSEDLGVGGSRPISLHRPHPTDKLEGWALLRLASRLKRSFGWGVETFVAGKK